MGTAQVVEFDRTELTPLVTLLFSTTIFGWSVAEDLYVIPDHARFIVKTDHHGVVHVEFQSDDDLSCWVTQLAQKGFTLPDETPDATFKTPDWMEGSEAVRPDHAD
jgi:hypothetical protein